MTLVTCANCHEDFDAEQGCCPGCGHPRVEPHGIPVPDLCAMCGTGRLALNGEPLTLGEKCTACGSRSIRVPRKPGQVRGDVLSEAGPGAGGDRPASLSNSPSTEEAAA